jgi:hypothetical protein
LDREYDLFEILPDGFPMWRATVTGLENATRKLKELAAQTANEVRVMHLPSNSIIAAVNVSRS